MTNPMEVLEVQQECLERLTEMVDKLITALHLLVLDLIEEGVIPDRREQK